MSEKPVLVQALPHVILLAATGVLGAGFLLGKVTLEAFLLFLGGSVLPSPLFNRPSKPEPDDEPEHNVP